MKSEPKHFSKSLFKSRSCPVCISGVLAFTSEYPSNEDPFRRKNLRYCARCGSGHLPDATPLVQRYREGKHSAELRKGYEISPALYFSDALRETNGRLNKAMKRADMQLKLLHTLGASLGTVLEFGSGSGFFLHSSKTSQPHALEPDKASRKHLDYLGATQYQDLDELPLAHFDLIVASHSIQHVLPEELHNTLVTLMRALNPGGHLLIEVPNGGHSYLHLDGTRQDPHTLFFTPQGLSEAVSAALKVTGGSILFQEAVAQPELPERKDAIYQPPPDPFFAANRGQLTVVCSAPQAEQTGEPNMAKIVGKRKMLGAELSFEEDIAQFDKSYTSWQLDNPGGRWTDFMAWHQIMHLSAGNAHASLGGNLDSGQEFRASGEATMKTLLKALGRATGKSQLDPNWTVCDYGCGTLRLGHHLMDKLMPKRYIGLDLATDLIDIGVKLCGDQIKKKQPVLSTLDDFETRFAETSCDLVCAFNVHCHVHPTDQREFIERIKALCKKPGSLFVVQGLVGANPVRYQRSGWAWPMSYYSAFLSPMQLIDVKAGTTVKKGRFNLKSHVMVFQTPREN